MALAAITTILILGGSVTAASASCSGCGDELHPPTLGAQGSAGASSSLVNEFEGLGPLFYNSAGEGVQRTPKIYPIFWGSNWGSAPGAELRSAILTFYNGLSNSAYQGILTQYFDSIGNVSPTVTVVPSYVDASAAISVNETQVNDVISKAIKANGWTPNSQSQLALFVSPGSTYEPGFVNGKFCAYHYVTKEGYPYTFTPYMGDAPFNPSCGNSGEVSQNFANTVADLSHEYAETVTNPIPVSPTAMSWKAQNGEEIADICGAFFKVPSGAWIREIYDDHQRMCSHEDLNPPHVYVLTEGKSGIPGDSQATLSGTVNPEGLATKYHFRYGPSEAYGSNTPEVSAGSSRTNQSVSQTISGLAQGTTYHYRFVATNSTGTSEGSDREFYVGAPPLATTEGVLGVTATGASAQGQVAPNGSETTYHFDYGTTTAYGNRAPLVDELIGSEGLALVGAALSGLVPQTTYHYRIVATNAYGPANGADRTFTTGVAALPTAETSPVTGPGSVTATLVGKVNPGNAETNVYFQYGLTSSYGKQTSKHVMNGSTTQGTGVPVSGLTPNTLYHYRILASNLKGSAVGSDMTFTTYGPPENTSLPTISPSNAAQGAPEASTNGTWLGYSPTFTYQWSSCNAAGAECVKIAGATASTYTPAAADVGHTLVVKVTANNGFGAASASSNATGLVRPVGQMGSEYALPAASRPGGIVTGSDGNLWFTEVVANKIGRITPSGTVTHFALPEKSGPSGIVRGPDGNVWFGESQSSKIGKITPAGVITEYALPKSTGPSGITVGADGNLWYTAAYSNKIGKITTAGTVTEYALPSGATPSGIASGPDGNLWITRPGWHIIAKASTSGSVVAEYLLSSSAYPGAIAPGADGNLWFTDSPAAKVGKITTSGTATQYSLGCTCEPQAIVAGPDGNMWFAQYAGKIGRITPAGAITNFAVPAGSGPVGIAAGPDNSLWFTNYISNKIGSIAP